MNTTICCLLYGDYPKLADRCLRPVSELYRNSASIRLGCNEVSDSTNQIISDLFPSSDNLMILKAAPQIYKYPMMELLFRSKPLDTEFVMWFDDDSYITDPSPVEWLARLEALMRSEDADMAGSIYHIPAMPHQNEWRRLHCSWFNSAKESKRTTFATGGWWMIRTKVLMDYGWPHCDLKHRGGDVLLGELIKHQSLKLINFKSGVAINADALGKESASKRRGYDEPPIGARITGP